MSQTLQTIPCYNKKKKAWNVVIETPQGSCNKYKFDPELRAFTLSAVLPEGMSFPYDFGFLPSTEAADGDPLDVLLLLAQPTFCGCVIPARLIGVIEAEQTEKSGKAERNDRVVAIPCEARNDSTKSLKDLDPRLLHDLQEFFVNYNRLSQKHFKVLGIRGPKRAEELAEKAMCK